MCNTIITLFTDINQVSISEPSKDESILKIVVKRYYLISYLINFNSVCIGVVSLVSHGKTALRLTKIFKILQTKKISLLRQVVKIYGLK